MSPIPRRSLLKAAAVAGAAAQFSRALGTPDAQAATDPDPVRLDWLEEGGLGAAPRLHRRRALAQGCPRARADVRPRGLRRKSRSRAVLAPRVLAGRLPQMDRARREFGRERV